MDHEASSQEVATLIMKHLDAERPGADRYPAGMKAIYCGLPDANTAFRIAQAVLADEETPHQEDDR